MDRHEAAQALLGRSWDAVEADAHVYIRQGADEVVRWVWAASSDSLWEMPQPMAGDEAPLRVLPGEPLAEARASTVKLGYGGEGRVIAARYFMDHWGGGTSERGAAYIDAVWSGDALLRFGHHRWLGGHSLTLDLLVHATYDDDARLIEDSRWFGEQAKFCHVRRTHYRRSGARLISAVSEEYERDPDDAGGLLDRTRVDYDYDGAGLLRVRWTTEHHRVPELVCDSGVSWFRRSPKALRSARKLLNQEIPGRILEWAARIAPSEPVYGLALMHSLDAPGLPPALGLGTVRELRAWRQLHEDLWAFRMRAWNPAEFHHFDGVPAELTDDPRFADAYALLNEDWRLGEIDREPATTLRRWARQLLEVDWSSILTPADDFVVFVVSDEISDDLPKQLTATIPRATLRRLEAGPPVTPTR